MMQEPFRLPFGEEQAVVLHSEADFLDHLQPNKRPFTDAAFTTRTGHISRTASIRIGSLIIAAADSSPVHLESTSEAQQTILLPVKGRGRITEGAKEHRISAGNIIVRSSYHKPLRFDYGDISGVTIRPDLETLTAEIAMRCPGSTFIGERLLTTGTNVFDGTLGGIAYRDTLLRLLAMVDHSGCDAAFLARIGLDDIVTRHIAEFIVAQEGLGKVAGKRLPRPSDAARAVDAICDHIQANIGTPLTVSGMTRMTGLTSEVLHEAFRSRFDCSPQEWQRNVLLDEARRLLSAWGHSPLVKDVAYDLGFSSAGSFASHYRRRFGERPSQTVQGRVRH